VKNVLKDAGRSIKANAKDPDSKPFGISTGPLVKCVCLCVAASSCERLLAGQRR
jgi:hypothetical protein